jgi:phosphonate utilization transcriptional regulator
MASALLELGCQLIIVDNLQSCYHGCLHRSWSSSIVQAASPTALQLVQSNSLPALVQVEIEQLILRGELAVGEHVNESELAARFGTSRGPVREALRALEESRLVRSEKNRGVFVREVSVAEADEIYDVREALDELIGQRVAGRATPPQLRELEAVIAEMDTATGPADIKDYHALNLKFHDLLVQFAGNVRLTESYRQLTKGLLLFRLRGLQDGGGMAVSNTEHKAVVAAIGARDGARAGQLLRQHAVESRARMHKAAGVSRTT